MTRRRRASRGKPRRSTKLSDAAADVQPLDRDAIRAHAVRVARGSEPDGLQDRTDVVDVWAELFSGRWSFMDHFDEDGRRYVVAHAREAGATQRSVLTEREQRVLAERARGQSYKQIAHDLGVSVSTVSACLQKGMKALGLETIADLAALLAAVSRGEAGVGSARGSLPEN